MATTRTVVKLATPKPKLPRPLDQELGAFVLDKCRELVEEYTALSRCAPEAFPFSERDLVTWYAEMRYKLLGAGRCSMCGAHVRHALPVMAELEENTVIMHSCLCEPCMSAQQSVARRVTLCLQRTAVEMPAAAPEAVGAAA
jgi:hypothetical protein